MNIIEKYGELTKQDLYKLTKGENINHQLCKTFKIAYIFILPCCVGLFVLAKPVLSII